MVRQAEKYRKAKEKEEASKVGRAGSAGAIPRQAGGKAGGARVCGQPCHSMEPATRSMQCLGREGGERRHEAEVQVRGGRVRGRERERCEERGGERHPAGSSMKLPFVCSCPKLFLASQTKQIPLFVVEYGKEEQDRQEGQV